MGSIEHKYRVCFLGDTATGKTEMFSRLVHGAAPKYTQPTIAIEYAEMKQVTDTGEKVKVFAWDTPGASLTVNATLAHCNRMSVIIFAYDSAVRTSYLHVPRWFEQVTGQNPGAKLILIATKRDLIESGEQRSSVQSEEAQQLAEKFGMEFHDINATSTKEVRDAILPTLDELHAEKNAGEIEWKIQAPDDTSKADQKSDKATTGGCWGFCRRS